MKNALLFCLLLFPGSSIVAQEPTQEPSKEVGSVTDDRYFSGATKDDKAFIDAVRSSLEESDLSRFQKWRIERRLNKPKFVAMLKKEVRAEVFWGTPDGEVPVAIDWSEIDWQAIISVALMLIKLFA